MNRTNSNVSLSPKSGTNRISNSLLMNGSGQLIYRRSPVPSQQQHQQPQSFDTLGTPSATSYNSEEIGETINSFEGDDFSDLSLKFDQLQKQIEVLTETQVTQDERYKRSRQENDTLLNKIHSLEDQLREIEFNAEHRAKEDEKRFRDTMAKQMKNQSQECEQHLHANFLLQQEIFSLKSDLIKNESIIKALRSEKDGLELELQEKNSELVSLDEEVHKLKLAVKTLKYEESVKSNLISILNEELEDSQNRSHGEQQQNNNNKENHSSAATSSYGNQSSPKPTFSSSRRSSVTSGIGDDFLSNNRALKDIDGLEMSLSKVRDENRKLRETNEELQAQLLNVQLEEGRSLVQEGNKSYSLADEMGDIDVQKLMKALKEQQDDNLRLRKYIDDMLLKIVTKNPEILEKTGSGELGVKEQTRQEGTS